MSASPANATELLEAPVDAREHELAASNFYWGVLDSPTQRALGKEQLGFLFESVLPFPLEEFHAVYRCIPGGEGGAFRYVGCGMRRSDLDELLTSAAGSAWHSLTPQELPSFVRAKLGEACNAFSPQTLNLLTGEYEPPTVRRLRRHWAAATAATLLCLGLILVIGLERRVMHVRQQAAFVSQERKAILHELLGPAALRSGGLLPELQLLAELRTLRATRQEPTTSLFPDDCTPVLAAIMSRWPNDLHLQTESLIVTPSNVTIRAKAPSSDDVQRLADSMLTLASDTAFLGAGTWRVQQPQINSSKDFVQTTLQIKNSSEPPR